MIGAGKRVVSVGLSWRLRRDLVRNLCGGVVKAFAR
jgi:hypothetical protein